ncbi:hypothetical protein NC653_041935 [Populus alba x Populus x berolinensis]|uniref:Uncharacterized protein n=1 Tax=Populus alba x Populus x berolinensis TaxID=444605 RepID=A0AAD6L9R8_9ROSI|nr:hypothetical protein NC653_041935 [Populus alba x Populus x berolinensis]
MWPGILPQTVTYSGIVVIMTAQLFAGGGIKSSKFVNSNVASSLSKDYPFQLITTFMLDLKLLSLQILDMLEMGFFSWFTILPLILYSSVSLIKLFKGNSNK